MSELLTDNFEKLKPLFKKETGLDWKTNLQTYIMYYNAKTSDLNWQVTTAILEEIRAYKKGLGRK